MQVLISYLPGTLNITVKATSKSYNYKVTLEDTDMFGSKAVVNLVTGDIAPMVGSAITKTSTYEQISEVVGTGIRDDLLELEREELNRLVREELGAELTSRGFSPDGVLGYFLIHLPHYDEHECTCMANFSMMPLVLNIAKNSIDFIEKTPDILGLILSELSDVPHTLPFIYSWSVYPLETADDIFNLVVRDIRYQRLNSTSFGSQYHEYFFPASVDREVIVAAKKQIFNYYKIDRPNLDTLHIKGGRKGFAFHL